MIGLVVSTVANRAIVTDGSMSSVSRFRLNATVWHLASGAGNAPVSIQKGLVHQPLLSFEATDQRQTYSRDGSPSGRRRPEVGWRNQPVGSSSVPSARRDEAATAASWSVNQYPSSIKSPSVRMRRARP